MSRKNKAMLAMAALAVVLLVGSGIARCTMSQAGDANEQQEPTEQVTEAMREQSEYVPQDEGNESDDPEGSGLEALIGTSWIGSDDSSMALSIVKGAFVESKDGQNSVTYWTVDDEQVREGSVTTTILASKSMTGAAAPTIVSITQENGETVIRCDALAGSYKRVSEGARTLYYSGITSKLAESMGVETSKIEAAVSARAAAVSPNAGRAIWDAEVWIDFANDTATTSFTLEDGASTMISVTRSSDGTIEAL